MQQIRHFRQLFLNQKDIFFNSMKIKGPLQSQNASGMIGPRITFSKRSSGQQARFQKKQKDAKSAAQLSQRGKFENASLSCRFFEYGVAYFGISFFGIDENYYPSKAKAEKMTGYNICIKEAIADL